MEIAQVLENTISADATKRQAAEQTLQNAAQENFPAYLEGLSQQLANAQNSSVVRAAAALVLKNEFSGRDLAIVHENQQKWINLEPAVKENIRGLGLGTLATADRQSVTSAAQFVAAIAAIDLPTGQWDALMPSLVQNVNTGSDTLKMASLTTIGYICEFEDDNLRESLSQHSNAILTAVVQGARKEEPNNEVRYAAMRALSESLEFVRSNFETEGERNYIMQVVCEATQSTDARIQQSAFGCLNRIMSLYYDKMRFYMEKALFGLTVHGMKSEDEEVSKLAVEFWCTVCEEELTIEEDNSDAAMNGIDATRPFFNFARVATNEVVPVLLELLTKQDEDATDDEYNISRAAYQCLCLYAQTVGGLIITPVLTFVELNLRHENWRMRDAAVSAFGAIMEGPDVKMLDPLIKQALPVLVSMMSDKVVMVKDSAAYALGRICECCGSAIEPNVHLHGLITALFTGLDDNTKMAGSCCWALMNLAESFGGDSASQPENPLSKHFADSVKALLGATERPDADNHLRTAAYEVLSSFVTNVGADQMPLIGNLLDHLVDRIKKTVEMQKQIVSTDDRVTLEEMQISLASVVSVIINRLDKEVLAHADATMEAILLTLQSLPPTSTVPEAMFGAVGAMANALEEDFGKYLDAFTPFLYNALGNLEDAQLCSTSIGLVSDIVRSVRERAVPHCDSFMNFLLTNLRSNHLNQQYKPAILQCFGDIAQAITGAFETYLQVVMQVLQQASFIQITPDSSIDMLDYVLSLREGIMDAYDGVIIAMKSSGKVALLAPYVQHIFGFLAMIAQDQNRTEALLRSSMGVLGDLADSFPNGEYANFFRSEWLMPMIKDIRANREFSSRTHDTTRWAKEQVRKQTSLPA
ncbi:karyopherin beta [Orbilia blumenaviensis]|uniref:Importin-95 n=2 Tax=Orbilia blumenaviensis TaxID=1796055 RepID=A0AAV9US43_9PEZI